MDNRSRRSLDPKCEVQNESTTKIYTRIKHDVSTGFSVLATAQTSLAAYLKFKDRPEVEQSLLVEAVLGLLLQAAFLGQLLHLLIEDEIFDERPVVLSLPVCAIHIYDARLNSITGTPRGSTQVSIAGVHPTFVTAVNKLWRNQWADLAQRMSDAEIRGGMRTDNDKTSLDR